MPDRDLIVRADRGHLYRLFSNLLDNALRHTPPSGTIALEAELEGQVVIVTVSDTGEGIAPEHLPHITERFYRSDAARTRELGGNGLGLAICKNIVEMHGGTLRIESVLGQGTKVITKLPLHTVLEPGCTTS